MTQTPARDLSWKALNVAKFEFNMKLKGPGFVVTHCSHLEKSSSDWQIDWFWLFLFLFCFVFFAIYTHKVIVSSYRMQAPW